MSIFHRRCTVFVALCAGAFACACAARGADDGLFDAVGDAGRGDDASVPGAIDRDAQGGGLGDVSVPETAPPNGETILYAHNGRALYKVDATDPNLALTPLGDFDCVNWDGGSGETSSMTDIAVDRSGKIYGIGPTMFFPDMTLSPGAVQCRGKGKKLSVTGGVQFFGATFAPVGTVDPNAEALVVGNTDGDLYQVDLATGALTALGNFGIVPTNDGNGHRYKNAGKRWELSGDLVFLENGGAPVGFATVRDCPNPPDKRGCNELDTLIELDLKQLVPNNTGSVTKAIRGQIVKGPSCQDSFAQDYGSMYGIAAFEGDIIGFSDSGFVVRIENDKGTACRIADQSGLTGNGGFSGAGVTTTVTVKAPPPR